MSDCRGFFVNLIFVLFSITLIQCGGGGESQETEDTDGDSGSQTDGECSTEQDCPAGYSCSPLGRCIDACRQNSDCGEAFCFEGYCVECLNDAFCRKQEAEAYCDRDYLVCRIGCENCQFDQQCLAERCRRSDSLSDGDSEGDEELPDILPDGDAEVAYCPPGRNGKVCTPPCSECRSSTESRICKDNGTGFTKIFCPDGEFCNFATGLCQAAVCEPLETLCDGQDIIVCREDASGYDRTPCTGGSTCLNGSCVRPVCSPESGTRLFSFEKRSLIASPDIFCQDAVNIGSASFEEKPDLGFVASFDGSAGRMLLPGKAGDFDESISIAFNLFVSDRNSGEQSIIQKGNPLIYELRVKEGRLAFFLSLSGRVQEIQSSPITLNNWLHVAATFDGMEMKLYLDAELQGDPLAVDDSPSIDRDQSPISIGAASDAFGVLSRPLDGYLDNLLLSGRALSEDEIEYLQGKPTPCSEEAYEHPESLCFNNCQRQVAAVPTNQHWTTTAIEAMAGEAIFIDPGGCPRPSDAAYCSEPSGSLQACSNSNCPMPDEARFSLLLRTGEDDIPRYAGERSKQISTAASALYFGYNDFNLPQNEGHVSVLVEQGYCPGSVCPLGMLPLPQSPLCIDRYEASCPYATYRDSPCSSTEDLSPQSIPGVIPWTNISAERARVACTRAGKRLCTDLEWLSSCLGIEESSYPYGDDHELQRCNDAFHQPPSPFTWLLPTGFLSLCNSDNGVLDLSGNAAEFVDLSDSAGYKAMAGKGESPEVSSTCTDGLSFDQEDEMTGFRCCMDN